MSLMGLRMSARSSSSVVKSLTSSKVPFTPMVMSGRVMGGGSPAKEVTGAGRSFTTGQRVVCLSPIILNVSQWNRMPVSSLKPTKRDPSKVITDLIFYCTASDI